MLLRRLRVSALACGFWRAMGAAGDMIMTARVSHLCWPGAQNHDVWG